VRLQTLNERKERVGGRAAPELKASPDRTWVLIIIWVWLAEKWGERPGEVASVVFEDRIETHSKDLVMFARRTRRGHVRGRLRNTTATSGKPDGRFQGGKILGTIGPIMVNPRLERFVHVYRSECVEINRIVRRADSHTSLRDISRLGLDRAGSKKRFAVVFARFWGSFGVNVPTFRGVGRATELPDMNTFGHVPGASDPTEEMDAD